DQTGRFMLDHPTPLVQIREHLVTMLNTIQALVSPKSSVAAQHLSGPVMIFRIYYYLIQSEQGWRLVLWFSVFLNVNLAILNMLPIPVLDGGHILLSLIEAVRRKPVNIRVLEVVQGTCLAVIVSYMLYI